MRSQKYLEVDSSLTYQAPMKRALVIRNIVDLNAEPRFHSKRKSQLLFGERVSIHAEREGYSEVEQIDGYRGWAPTLALCEISEADWKNLDEAFTLRVCSPVAEVFTESDAPVPPYFLSYGSIVYPGPAADEDGEAADRIEIASPDSLKRWIRTEDVVSVSTANSDSLAFSESVLLAGLQFLGVPYLWGGRSSLGLDCSGLTQLVYSLNGVELPRDSADQRGCGTEIGRDEIDPGDLIFSEGHVVIYMGEDLVLHASQKEGGVTVSSYSPDKPSYRKDLDEGFQTARRFV